MPPNHPKNLLTMNLVSGSPFLRCTGDIYRASADESESPIRTHVVTDSATAAVLDSLPNGKYLYDFSVTGGAGKFELEVHEADKGSYDTATAYSDVHAFEVKK